MSSVLFEHQKLDKTSRRPFSIYLTNSYYMDLWPYVFLRKNYLLSLNSMWVLIFYNIIDIYLVQENPIINRIPQTNIYYQWESHFVPVATVSLTLFRVLLEGLLIRYSRSPVTLSIFSNFLFSVTFIFSPLLLLFMKLVSFILSVSEALAISFCHLKLF